MNLRVGRVTPCAPPPQSPTPGAHGVSRPTTKAWFRGSKRECYRRILSMNLTQKAGASSTHSKRCRAVSTFQRLAKRLECVRLAGALGSWSRCAVVKPWRLSMNLSVATGILPAGEGGHPAARNCCYPVLRVDCLHALSAGLEAPALRQAGCLPLRFEGANARNFVSGNSQPFPEGHDRDARPFSLIRQ